MERLDPNTIIENLIGSNRVVVFSKSTCPFCIQVKKLFNQENIEYVVLELDIEKGGKAIMNALIEKTGHKTVPNVFISGKHIGGCDDLLRLFETGTLNAMCPPKAHGFEYDLVVIGGGSGGLAAAKEASLMGKRVAVCDFVVPSPVGTTWGLGGTCVNVGCIPKKLMHQAALLGTAVRDAAAFGWAVPEKVEHDWEKMAKAIQNHVRSLNFGYRVALKEKNVIYFNSYAQFVTANKIKLTNKKGAVQEVTSDQFIIAVGGRPAYPPNTPGAREFGITSDDLFWLSKSPGKTLLVGASYIALECAGFLAGLGLDVTVMVRSILLRGFDSQMAEMIGEYMKSHGVKFIEECVPNSIEQVSAGPPQLLKVKATKNDKSLYEEEFNTVIFAVGRTACTSGVGLEEIGVKLHNNGKIIADSGEQSSVKNIYAIGDVLYGRPELTPVAIQAGKLLVRRLFADAGVLTDYANVPTTVFTPLEYGCVGMTEEAAKHKYGYANIEVYHSHFKPLEATLPGRADRDKGYAKIICVKLERERVVGLHVLGPNAGEITQGFAMGVKMHAKKMDFEALVGIHPTCAEIFTTLTVTKASGESIDKTSC